MNEITYSIDNGPCHKYFSIFNDNNEIVKDILKHEYFLSEFNGPSNIIIYNKEHKPVQSYIVDIFFNDGVLCTFSILDKNYE